MRKRKKFEEERYFLFWLISVLVWDNRQFATLGHIFERLAQWAFKKKFLCVRLASVYTEKIKISDRLIQPLVLSLTFSKGQFLEYSSMSEEIVYANLKFQDSDKKENLQTSDKCDEKGKIMSQDCGNGYSPTLQILQ